MKGKIKDRVCEPNTWLGISAIAGGIAGILSKQDLQLSIGAIIGGLGLIFSKGI